MSNWIPTGERLPVETGWVLVTVETDGRREVGIARAINKQIGLDSPDMAPRVTHWMPLPEPAKNCVAGLVLCVAVLVGCAAPNPAAFKSYTVTVTRPDGVVHRTLQIQSTEHPRVESFDDEGGCLRVLYWNGSFDRYSTQPFPSGWLVEVEPNAEASR
jgi:hypothetical protein